MFSSGVSVCLTLARLSLFLFSHSPSFSPLAFSFFLILDAVLRHDTKDSSSDRRTSRRYTTVHLKICPSSIKVAAHAARMANVLPSGCIDFRRLTALVNFEQSTKEHFRHGKSHPIPENGFTAFPSFPLFLKFPTYCIRLRIEHPSGTCIRFTRPAPIHLFLHFFLSLSLSFSLSLSRSLARSLISSYPSFIF